MLPKSRSDRGRSRALPPVVTDHLIALKEELPQLSIPQLIRVAFERGIATEAQPVPRSTVHRLFSRTGLMHKTAEPSEQDRRRFAFAQAGELWMSDVMHGPTVATGERGQRHKAYLIAFIDDATRLIPYAAFALAENTKAFLPIFKPALLRRGEPMRVQAASRVSSGISLSRRGCSKKESCFIRKSPQKVLARNPAEGGRASRRSPPLPCR